MILATQRFFLILLGLLQLIAPLVHAHSNLQFSQFGLHLPTLEVYSSHKLPAKATMQAIDTVITDDSTIVSISHGIKNLDTPDIDNSVIYLFFITLFVFAYSVLCTRTHVWPPSDLKIKKTSLSLASPRAPPVSSYC